MAELCAKVQMSHRLRRSPSGNQHCFCSLLTPFLSITWLFVSYLFISVFGIGQKLKPVLSKGFKLLSVEG